MGMWTIPKRSVDSEKFSEKDISEFIETLAQAVIKRRMSVPVILALELVKPLSFVGSQALVALSPALEIVFDPARLEKVQCVLGDRDRIEALMQSIEKLENKEGA